MARKTGRVRARRAGPLRAGPLLAGPLLARPVQRGRIEPGHVPGPGVRACDGHAQLARGARSQRVEQARDLSRDPGAHQHIVNARQHGAIGRGGSGHLDFLQVVDPDKAVVTLLGQVYLDEVAGDRQLGTGRVRAQPQPGNGAERLPVRDPAGHEVPPQHTVGHAGQREFSQRAPDVPPGVAALQPAGQHRVQGHPGHHAEMPGRGHRAGQPPAGDSHPHAALDERRPGPAAGLFPAHQRAAGW